MATTGNQIFNTDLTAPVNNSGGYVALVDGASTGTTSGNNIQNSGDAIIISGDVVGANIGEPITISNDCNITIGNSLLPSSPPPINIDTRINISNGVFSYGGSMSDTIIVPQNSVTPSNSVIFLKAPVFSSGITLISVNPVSIAVLDTISSNFASCVITEFNSGLHTILVPSIGGPYNLSYDFGGVDLVLTGTGTGTPVYRFRLIFPVSLPFDVFGPIERTYTYITPAAAAAATSTSIPTPTSNTYSFYYVGALPQVPSCICFAKYTNILTDKGYVQIENLSPGDNAMVYDNGIYVPKPIKWIGYFKQKISTIDSYYTAPIRIKQSAISENVPSQDLLVSPGHSILIDDYLIQARHLVNDTTICRETSYADVEYYHIKLDTHSIINANGLNTESYFDLLRENRKIFANGADIDDDLCLFDPESMDLIETVRARSAAHLVLDDVDLINVIRERINRVPIAGQ